MITSKQRAYLRKLANPLPAMFHIGKQGLTPEFTKSVDEALEANELIKIDILNNSDDDVRETADKIHARTHSEIVQIIGKKIILYRRSTKKPIIEIPNDKQS